MKKKGILIVVSGFSGSGKGTLMKQLLKEFECYALSISATTRAPREGEENGRDYFFVTKDCFRQMIREGALYEYASYQDNYYGTPRQYVDDRLAEGKDVILEIDVRGRRRSSSASRIRFLFSSRRPARRSCGGDWSAAAPRPSRRSTAVSHGQSRKRASCRSMIMC